MAIDITSDELVTITEATRIIPGRPSLASVWRWRTKGVRGHRLECISVGGRFFTSRQAIERFIAATTAATAPDGPRSAEVVTNERKKQLAEADRVLQTAGI